MHLPGDGIQAIERWAAGGVSQQGSWAHEREGVL